MADNFLKQLNMLLPDDTEPPYLKEILQQADRPTLAGIGAEKSSIKSETAMKMNSTLNNLRVQQRNPNFIVTKKKQTFQHKNQVQPKQASDVKIIQKRKGYDRFSAFK